MAAIRRLAAILAMDVEGFTSLVEADEASALRALTHLYRDAFGLTHFVSGRPAGATRTAGGARRDCGRARRCCS